jgi:hypothetical protein
MIVYAEATTLLQKILAVVPSLKRSGIESVILCNREPPSTCPPQYKPISYLNFILWVSLKNKDHLAQSNIITLRR